MKKVLFLAGPTASGKTGAALALAEKMNAEIISADSMQIYRGMDIGTAKPSAEDLARVQHHLIDIVEPDRNFSVHEYFVMARNALRDIDARGKTGLVTGGTGLYVKALIEGLSEQPQGDDRFRAEMESRLAKEGIEPLAKELEAMDPELAATTDLKNPRRVIRALDIQYLSGKKPSELRGKGQPLTEEGFQPVVCALNWEREALYQRVNERVDQMFDQGLVEEVRALASRKLSATARQAVGYKELLDRMGPSGDISGESLKRAAEEIKKNSRHLAKRQMTWLRGNPPDFSIACSPSTPLDDIVGTILSFWSES